MLNRLTLCGVNKAGRNSSERAALRHTRKDVWRKSPLGRCARSQLSLRAKF